METKKCSKCGRELPLSEFGRYKKTKDGLRNHCKECVNAEARHSYRTRASNTMRLKGAIGGGEERTPNQIIDEIKERVNILRGIGFDINVEINYTKTIKI